MSFDFAQLQTADASENGRPLVIYHPLTGEKMVHEDGTEVTFFLKGTDSFAYRRVTADLQRKQVVLGENVTDADRHDLEAEAFANLVVSWKGVVFDGKDLTYSFENAKKILSKSPWLRRQLEAFIVDRANFQPPS